MACRTTRFYHEAMKPKPDEAGPKAKPPRGTLVGRAARFCGVALHAAARTLDGKGEFPDMPRLRKGRPGAAAGIEPHQLDDLPTQAGSAYITCIDYSPEHVLVRHVDNIDEFLTHHRPEWTAVRWINVDGLTDLKAIRVLAERYQLHPLAIEDVLHVPQRPKMESYVPNAPAADASERAAKHADDSQIDGKSAGPSAEDDLSAAASAHYRARLFVISRMVQVIDGKLASEQISLFLGHRTILTFQEDRGDVWDPVRERLKRAGSRLRQSDASFLLYSLLDAIIDHCFPILERYGDRLEELEDIILENPGRHAIHEIHQFKREMLLLRRAVWPMREVIQSLQREPHECMAENTRMYLRDLYDHVIQIIDLIETYREIATGLTETYMSSLSIRMNEVMKVLTIIGTIFIPLTFLAGVYGMNMPIPENHYEISYPLFWLVCLVVSVGMLAWFKRRGWL